MRYDEEPESFILGTNMCRNAKARLQNIVIVTSDNTAILPTTNGDAAITPRCVSAMSIRIADLG